MAGNHSLTSAARLPADAIDGRCRAVIENITPSVDAGRFAVKRVIGDCIDVQADVFTDGHDAVRCRLLSRKVGESRWSEVEMRPLGNDRWSAQFAAAELGRYEFTVGAWTDRYLTWLHEFERRNEAEDILIALRVGAQLLESAAGRASGSDAEALRNAARILAQANDPRAGREIALDRQLTELATRFPDRRFEYRHTPAQQVIVDLPLARFGAWYELFPRSTAAEPEKHGTFRDCEARLPYIAQMGFDVLYLPPIHPIGHSRRKGPNNSLQASPDDVGSPWAIGGAEGGHDAIHPQLGTLADLQRLLAKAREQRLEIALDIAFQCSPDHPYVREHPEWFRIRPDGTVQYAENPPKKYQDIYPFDFETELWQTLFAELTRVVQYWIAQGVRIFRVDNPHTKPFTLWERLIGEIKQQHPEVIFLSEAFTRPKVMQRLAKLGFTQSYTYFTWRNTQRELREYFTELSMGAAREYFRPNVWPNTPDILPEYLQFGGRAAFMIRLVLAATLSATYGIYGPAFELMEHVAREPGSEEYRDSEKYQIRHWDLARADSLASFIARVNRIRRDHVALHDDLSLRFLDIDNDQLVAYAKVAPDRPGAAGGDSIVVVANLDPHNVHAGWLTLPLAALGLRPDRPYRMHDLLGGGSFLWQGPRNYVQLDPRGVVAHVFAVQRHVRSEREFDYFM